MKKLRLNLIVLVACGLLLGACKSAEVAAPKSAEDELVDKNITARGGLANIRAIESVTLTGEAQMMGMSMPLTIYQKRPKMMRSEVEVPSMNIEVISGYDGETAWMINPMMGGSDPQPVPEEQARSVRDQADMDGMLVDYEEKGYTLEYLGEEEVRGKNAHKLKVLRPDSPEIVMYLDAETFLEVKAEGEGINPQTGSPAQMATYLTDYRDVNGVMMPFSLEVEMGGQPLQTVKFTNVRANTDLDDALFAFPEQ